MRDNGQQITGSRWKVLGFTLIEMMLVLVVLAVVSAMSVPSLVRYTGKFKVKQVATDIAHCLRYAQGRSIANNAVLRLVMDDDRSSFWLEKRNDEQGNVFEKVDEGPAKDIKVSEGLELQASGHVINVYPDGNMSAESLVFCRDKKCYEVTTRRVRGSVELLEWEKDEG